ncbi:phage integrase family protein [Leptospirillum ferriphilum ML-04]|uniref:Phage integrase family protein n=1 Tax=Leptospirillum ferriphilum (strain ML-04) TaxID=1048260 RepID=J9Z703_LEPFM|nr:phage integrase family protein [Leptospirillum ferriphilum ML-04]
MALTDVLIRNSKPKDKAFKLSDGGGLYLLVNLNAPIGGDLITVLTVRGRLSPWESIPRPL